MRLLAVVAAACLAVPAATQERAPFTGVVAGPELGLHEHHFYLVASENGQATSDRYWRSWDVGGGAFAGYDLAVAPRVRIIAAYPNGSRYSETPCYGVKAVGRAGYVVGTRTLL
jgi:outer membrane immunogenic protein